MSRRFAVAFAVALAAIGAVTLPGCGPLLDAPVETSGPTAVVDYSGFWGVTLRSEHTLAPQVPSGLLSRVVVDPSMWLPASRASHGSLDETIRPKSSVATVLFDSLIASGSVVLAPAVLHAMLAQGCIEPACRDATWIEQLIWLARLGPSRATPLRDPPTAALPVDALGIFETSIAVSVHWSKTAAQYEVARLVGADPTNLCPGLALSIPVAEFATEVLDLKTGALLLRGNESQTIQANAPWRWTIQPIQQRSTGHGLLAADTQMSQAAYCGAIATTWAGQVLPLLQQDHAGQRAALRAVVDGTLAPLRRVSAPAALVPAGQ